MSLMRDWQSLESVQGGYATIGNFDGVHRGHQAMLNVLTSRARAENVPAIAVTFDPHPIALLRPDATPPVLTTIEHRAELLHRFGVDVALVLHTDRSLLALTADEFFDSIVRNKLKARGLVEGPNFFFGRNRSGNITVLRTLCNDHGLSFDVAPPATVDEQLVSSSVIRSLLETGQMGHAVRLLGHHYRISGRVGTGAQRGRTIGFPTANIHPNDPYKLIPSHGVYAGIASVENKRYKMVCNIGVRPTVDGDNLSIEAHLFDFNKNIYGEHITLFLVQYLRNEQKFESVEALKSQIFLDAQQAQNLVSLD